MNEYLKIWNNGRGFVNFCSDDLLGPCQVFPDYFPVFAEGGLKNNSYVFLWNMVILVLDYSLYT